MTAKSAIVDILNKASQEPSNEALKFAPPHIRERQLPPAAPLVTQTDEARSNIRGAACLNIINICREQSGRSDFTDLDFQCLRIFLLNCEIMIANGQDAIVPAGFGAVETYQKKALDSVAQTLSEATAPAGEE